MCFDLKGIELPFTNAIESDSLSVLTYHYLYNGGGVGIADFNNDGHSDIFLGGNLVSSKLLLGDGKMGFEDVTTKAGLETSVWINGISLIDLNNDGFKDIYLSVGGPDCKQENCRNLLYLNNGDKEQLLFTESAKSFGIDHGGYSQQALFFDADLDGDLDMYQLQNFVDPKSKNYPQPKRYFSKKSFDKFFINEIVETGQLKFRDASEEWNVALPGFGLGIAMDDFNRDGYPDLYIANDFITDDILYINQKGKGFKDASKDLLKHTSYNSMGVDLADMNNDLIPEILVVDMLPFENQRQKTMLGAMNYDKFLLSREENYNAQFIRNTLQFSNGQLKSGLAKFSELAAHAGLHETDWSWSPLIADFDNDGDSDVFISNGYGKNITDLDFVNYNSNQVGFGGKQKAMDEMKKSIDAMPAVKLANQYFEKQENQAYTKHAPFEESITNGVAYGDLDNDGDLDLVLNNLDEASMVIKNQSIANFLKVKLVGGKHNRDAIGSEVLVSFPDGQQSKKTLSPVRSYLSSMDDELLFGLGSDTLVNVQVKWPDNSMSYLESVVANTQIRIDFEKAERFEDVKVAQKPILNQEQVLEPAPSSFLSAHDFSLQPLLMKSCRKNELLLAKSGLSKKILLGNYDGALCELNEDFTVSQKIEFLDDVVVTDMKTLKDKTTDAIFVCSYSSKNEKSYLSALQWRNSNWMHVANIDLPLGSYSLEITDYQDNAVIVGLAQYPHAKNYPQSNGDALKFFTYDNEVFTPYPMKHNADLHCLTAIKYVDLNTDGQKELLLIGEWMAPQIGQINRKSIEFFQIPELKNLSGLWQDIEIADFDNDGDLDILLANIGDNTRYAFSPEHPLQIVAEDLDENGSIDPVMSHYNPYNNTTVTYHSRDDIAKQLPSIKNSFGDYKSFATASFESVLSSFTEDALTYYAEYNQSILLENKGQRNFSIRELPPETQYSIVNKFAATDINQDGLIDIIALSNCYNMETHNGNLDGSNGLVIINEGDWQFKALSTQESGLNLTGTGQDILQIPEQSKWLATTNNGLFLIETEE